MSQAVVAIAGATGFVGTAIRNSLLEQFTVRGLTRSAYKLSHPDPNDPVQWVHCNAYSASSVEQALQDQVVWPRVAQQWVSRPFPSWNRSILTEIYLCLSLIHI